MSNKNKNLRTVGILFFLLTLMGLSLPKSGSAHAPSKTDSFSLASGKKVFQTHCSGCHGASGQGSFGPNLCDNFYIHGHTYHSIVHVIKKGVSDKGMTAFGKKLTHAQVRDVAHYITLSLKGTKPAGAKAGEGKKHGT